MGSQACLNGKLLGTSEVVREGITDTVHAGSDYEM